MSLFLHVFCTSADAFSYDDAVGFIEEGSYFDHGPVFKQTSRFGDKKKGKWSFDLVYDKTKRPIQISFGPTGETTRATIDEAINDNLPEKPGPKVKKLIEKLKGIRQELVIETGGDPGDDCWEMIDNFEAHVAEKLDGVIYVAGEGFYDAELTRLWKF